MNVHYCCRKSPPLAPLPEPDESSPHCPKPFFDINFNTITFMPKSSFVASFSSGSSSTVKQLSAAPHAQPSPFRAPWFDQASNTFSGVRKRGTSHYTVFSNPPLRVPFCVLVFFSLPSSRAHLSLLSLVWETKSNNNNNNDDDNNNNTFLIATVHPDDWTD